MSLELEPVPEVVYDNSSDTEKELSTLLDKALAYRKQNTETWEAKERDREEQFLEMYGIYQEDPFLAAYYKKQDEKERRKKKDQAKRKLESPQIVARLLYTLADAEEVLSESSDSYEDTFRRESVRSGSDVGETDIFTTSPCCRQLSKSQQSELTITIVKGKYLLNWLDTFQRKYDSCKIKCVLYPKSKRSGKKIKTRDTYVNLKGTARYNHVFKISGFSPEELEERHIVFEVSGKNNQRKDVIGKVVIGGSKSTISDSNLNCRGPTVNEYEPWQKAIENPGTTVDVRMVVHRPQDEFYTGETNTQLNRAQLLKTSPRLSRKWANRSPIKKNKLGTM